jgi:hypothetical protein
LTTGSRRQLTRSLRSSLKGKFSIAEEQQHLDKWKKEAEAADLKHQKHLQNNAAKGYILVEKALLFAGAPFIVFSLFRNYNTLSSLKKENFRLKIRQRYRLLLGGIFVWLLVLWISLVLSKH